MRTPKQIEASRLNGAKSRGPVTAEGKRISSSNSRLSTGPVTPEGKARSSRNATKHALLANSVTLPAESKAEFIEVLNEFRNELQPVGFLEERAVETMAVADWRRRRVWVVEMARIAHATRIQEEMATPLAVAHNDELPAIHTALAISNLADNGRTLELLRRYEVTFSREFRRAHTALKELQAARLASASPAAACLPAAASAVAAEEVRQPETRLHLVHPEPRPTAVEPETASEPDIAAEPETAPSIAAQDLTIEPAPVTVPEAHALRTVPGPTQKNAQSDRT